MQGTKETTRIERIKFSTNRIRLLARILSITLFALVPMCALQAEPVRVIWDTQGVPHVFAETDEGACFGFGYATGMDRPRQIDASRREARDNPSSIRDLGRAEGLEALYERVPDRIKAIHEAFAAGVNKAWSDAGHKSARPWEAMDSFAIGLLMTRWRNGGGHTDIHRLGLLQLLQERYGEREGAWRAADILKAASPDAIPTVFPGEDMGAPEKYQAPAYPPDYPAAEPDIGEALDEKGRPEHAQYWDNPLGPMGKLADERRQAYLTDPEDTLALASVLREDRRRAERLFGFGSQEWLVAPEKSATGHAVLFDAPSLGIGSPSRLYQIHLEGDNYHVAGATIPGLAAISVGRNRYGAWGFTDAHNDQEDAFVEVLHPDDPTRYWHKGQWKTMQERSAEVVLRTGKQTITFYYTVHGPVVNVDREKGIAYAVQRLPDEELGFVGFDALMRARNWKEAREARRYMVAAVHFAWADRDGHILYQVTGGLPIRPAGTDGQYPVPGTGDWDWLGQLDPMEMPAMLDPKAGFIANANSRAAPGWRFNFLTANYPPPYGLISIIHPMLKTDASVTVDEQVYITRAFGEKPARWVLLKPMLLDSVGKNEAVRNDADVQLAAAVLRDWDCRRVKDPTTLPGTKTVYKPWSAPGQELANAVWDCILDVVMRDYKELITQNPASGWSLNKDTMLAMEGLTLSALQGRTAIDYFDDPETDRVETKDAVIADALRTAVQKMKEAFGSDNPDDWTTEQEPRPIKDSRNNEIAMLSPLENRHNTYRQLVVCDETLSDARWLVAPGNNENPASEHFKDNLENYQRLMLNPMWFEEEDVKANAARTVELSYGTG